MFSLFRRLRRRAEIKRLEHRAQADATPRSFCELCRTLLAYGDAPKAMKKAQLGLARFPHCEDLRDVLRHTWRLTRTPEIDALRKQCGTTGDIQAFTKLVQIYVESEEYDEALLVAEALSQRYPNFDGAWLMQGEVLLRRFYKDHVASDAQRGIAQLKRVLELNERSFDAHYLLTKVYHHIGAISKALFHLYKALDLQPEHEGARRLYASLIALPLERDEEHALLRELEENDHDAPAALANDEREPLSQQRRAQLLASINRLSLLNGVTKAALVSPEAEMIGVRGDVRLLGLQEPDPLCDLARRFRKAATVSAKRMGIGGFQSAVLTAGDRILHFQAVDSAVLLVETDRDAWSDVIKTECSHFVATGFTRQAPQQTRLMRTVDLTPDPEVRHA